MSGLQRWTIPWNGASAGTKVLIVLVMLLVPASLAVVSWYAAAPVMTPLLDQPLGEPDRSRIAAHLQSQGTRYELVGDRIQVPSDQRTRILASLQLSELLPEDTSRGFAALVGEQRWYHSSDQNRQLYTLALQEELARVLEAYPWVRRATVLISHPRQTGFGATHYRPTASVNVVTRSEALDAKRADAIASLVSGAVAEMRPSDVAVIDAQAGRQWKARSGTVASAGDAQDLKHAIEDAYRLKIVDALRYIEQVIVVVDVDVDTVRRESQSQEVDRDKSLGLLTREQTQVDSAPRAPWSGGLGALRPQEPVHQSSEREFEPLVSRRQETAVDPGGLATRISATVNVPRSFFVSLYARGRSGPVNPTDAELQPTIDEHLPRIRRQVEPLIQARQAGQVVVDVYPDTTPAPQPPLQEAQSPAAAMPLWIDGEIWAGASLVTLGLVAIVAMWLMFRRVACAESRQGREPAADEPAAERSTPSDDAPFAGARQCDPHSLVEALGGEHPQTVAVVLAHLPDREAAQVLAGLDPDLQAQVVSRMAQVGSADPQALREVEEALDARLSEVSPLHSMGGPREIAQLLSGVDAATRQQVLRSLEIESPDLVDEVRRFMFSFADLQMLDDQALERLLRQIEPQDLAIALQTAEQSLRRRILRSLPRETARDVKRRMSRIGPVRIRDVERIQAQIADTARRLDQLGVIALPAGAGYEMQV